MDQRKWRAILIFPAVPGREYEEERRKRKHYWLTTKFKASDEQGSRNEVGGGRPVSRRQREKKEV